MAWPAAEILEVKVGYQVNGQQCYNVLHYLTGGDSVGLSPASLTEAFLLENANDANGEFVGEFKKLFGQNVFINLVTAQGIYPTRYAMRKMEFNVNGTIELDCEAQNLQATIIKRGDLGNRHNTGAVRIGGLPTSAYNDGNITPAYLSLMQTLIDNLLIGELGDGASAAVYTPAILNKTKVIVNGKPKWNIDGCTVITAWDTEQYLRTQRTRTKGRGI